MRSVSVPELNANATVTDADVRSLFANASALFQAAGASHSRVARARALARAPLRRSRPRSRAPAGLDVEFAVTSVSRQDAQRESAYREQMLDRSALPQLLLAGGNSSFYSLVPSTSNNASTSWYTVVLVNSMGGVGPGAYNPNTRAVVHALAPQDSSRIKELSQANLLARNLAAALGLARASCWQHGDSLMRTNCGLLDELRGLKDARTLDSCQLSRAESHVSALGPWDGEGDATCPCDGCGGSLNVIGNLAVTVVCSVAFLFLVLLVFVLRKRKRRARKKREEGSIIRKGRRRKQRPPDSDDEFDSDGDGADAEDEFGDGGGGGSRIDTSLADFTRSSVAGFRESEAAARRASDEVGDGARQRFVVHGGRDAE